MLVSTQKDIQYHQKLVSRMTPFRLKWSKLALIALPAAVLLLILAAAHWNQPSCSKAYLQEYSFQHVFDYCNGLSQQVSGQEGTVPPSDGYKLEAVYVTIRHGDRSNLHTLPNYPQVELNCAVGERIINLEPQMQQYHDTMKEHNDYHKSNPKTSSFHGYDLYPSHTKCGSGELTPTGAAQHVRNGQFLKKRYVDALKLFEGTSKKIEQKMLIRSTTKTRTFQSAVAFLYGFLPSFDMSLLAFEAAEANPMCNSNSPVDCNCNAIQPRLDLMANTQAQFTPHVMAQKRTRNTYESIGDTLGVMASQLPRPSHVFDVSMVHVCHHQFLPGNDKEKCIDSWSAGNVYDIIQDNGKEQVTTAEYQQLVRLKMYPLLLEIQEHMLKVAKAETPVKFMLFSGHDSTVEPLAAALNISDGHWPRYASRLIIELYSKASKTEASSQYIRVLYDGDVMTHHMFFCKNKMTDMELGLCPLEHFQQFLATEALRDFGHEGDYTKLCNA